VSTTLLVKPGPVVDFLLQNQNVQKPNLIDWTKVISLLDLEVVVLCFCVYELWLFESLINLGKKNVEKS